MEGSTRCGIIAAVLCTTLLPAAAHASGPIDISANAGIVSDYRFRGLSLSGRKPAVQGGIDASLHETWFVGGWATTIKEYAGADVELDIYAGRTGTIAGLDYSLGAYGYFYPGGSDVDYVELQGNLSRDLGPVTVEGELAFVPRQWNSDTTNLYMGGKLSVPIGDKGWSFLVRGGRENGFYRNKLDWEIGLAFEKDWLTMSASLLGSNYSGATEAGADGRAAVVAGLVATF
jgi:uncharacterized protein (TIGR02001 family)